MIELKQFNQPIFSFLFLCISNTEKVQTADNVQIHIEALFQEMIEQPVKNQQLLSNTKQDNFIKKTMSRKDFFLFLIKQGVLLFFCKFLYGFGFLGRLILFKPTTTEIILTLLSILLLIFYFFILSQYIKTYDHIPVSFSFFLIILCLPFFLFFKKKSLLRFFLFLPEIFNPFYFIHFSTFFQKDVELTHDDINTTIPKSRLSDNKIHFIGKIFLSIFVLLLIIICLILKKKENKFNGFLFVSPKILSTAVSFSICYGKKYSDLKYNIYFYNKNIKIKTLNLIIKRTSNVDEYNEKRSRKVTTGENITIVDLKVTISDNDIICNIVK